MRNATIAGVLFGIMLAGGARAQDWPQWRGPNRDAKAAGFEAPKTWPKELTKKWTVPVGGGDATPALAGDKLYSFTRQGEDEVIRCLDAATGNEVWKEKYAAGPATGPAGGMHAGPRSSPAVADGKVVTLGARGTLSCLDAAGGKVLWRKDDYKGWPRFFVSSSPIITNGLVIAQVGGNDNGALVAYELASGNEKWKWTGGSPGYASPVLVTVGGTPLVVAETEREIVAVNAADGKLAWKAPFAAQRMQYNASTPVVDGQTVIYGGGGRPETAVKLDKEGDGVGAKELWTNKDNSVQFNSPVLKDGVIYGLSDKNQFFAIDAESGKTDWSAPLGAANAGGQANETRRAPPQGRGGRMGRGMGRGGYGSIVDAGSVLLALTPASELIVFAPSAKGFKEVAKYKVAESPTYAYPVVSGNRVYVKDQNAVTLWTVE
jgi:outer membrane protein assembly factor BamB